MGGEVFKTVSTRHNVPMGDFPNPQEIQAIDEVLGRGVPRLLEQVEQKRQFQNAEAHNPFHQNAEMNPFDEMQLGKSQWIVSQSKKQEYDQKFYSLSLTEGKASGGQVKQVMLQSQLSNQVLGKVWQLADIDKDGAMTDQEFALCCYLLDLVKAGNPLPQQLPDDYIPPIFRQMVKQQRRQEQQQQMQQQNQMQQQYSNTQGGGLPPPSAW